LAGIYNELDMVIKDYVGTHEFDDDACADPVLYDSIALECTQHINGKLALDKMTKDARYCVLEWEQLINDQPIKRGE